MGRRNHTGIGPAKFYAILNGRLLYGRWFSDRIVGYRSWNSALANGEGRRRLVVTSDRARRTHGFGCLSARCCVARRSALMGELLAVDAFAVALMAVGA